MAAVTPVPFALALLLGMALFVALTCYLVQDARRPFDFGRATSAHAQHVLLR